MNIAPVPMTEISFHPTSFCDNNGRVFRWKGGIYRGITSRKAAFYSGLLRQGIAKELCRKNLLVGTEPADLALEGYDFVVKHRAVPFVSYPFEWCAEMLRDAALLVLDLETELAHRGLELDDHDANPWNVLFDACVPVFVDFCAVVPADPGGRGRWKGKDDFCSFLVHPLELMARGQHRIARRLLHDYDNGVLLSDFEAVTGRRAPPAERLLRPLAGLKQKVPDRWKRKVRSLVAGSRKGSTEWDFQARAARLQHLRQMRRRVESIRMPSEASNPAAASAVPFTESVSSSKRTPKEECVGEILARLRPASLLHAGCGHGCHARLATRLGIRVVALDKDEKAVSECYRTARRENLDILPLVLDIRFPSPGYGVCNQELAPAAERLGAQLVLALGAVRRLALERSLPFEQIADTLHAFSARWLLVEFAPRQDSCLLQDTYPWYSEENFVSAFRRRFHLIGKHPLPAGSNCLFLFER